MNTFETYDDVVRAAWNMHKSLYPMNGYYSVVSMHGAARYSKFMKDQKLLEEMLGIARPFLDGKVTQMSGAYGKTNYCCGGNFTAWLGARGYLDDKDVKTLERYADALCNEQERAGNRMYQFPGRPDFFWIDSVYGVCPFLVWIGLATGRKDFIEEALFQMKMHHQVLFDPSCKLYHQAINARGDGKLTPAHWSRGMGWAMHALAELAYEIPKDHPDYPAILEMYRLGAEGCAASQDENGMWHQAIESLDTYVESSGTALIAYALARGSKNGTLDREKFLPVFIKAIKGLARYVALDGSVFNCCVGCLAPGNGTVEEYAKVPWRLNDPHAFGPVILAFGEAQHLWNCNIIPSYKEL